MNIDSHKAFTLVEIMIVVAIIGIILAIALPNYVKSGKNAKKTVCIANLEKIDSAIDQWVLDKQVSQGVTLSESDINEIYNSYVKGGEPKCPSGGIYTIHVVGSKPQVTCSFEDEGHKLP